MDQSLVQHNFETRLKTQLHVYITLHILITGVNSKLYASKFSDNLNFCLNLRPKEEKFIQIYLVI
jgi:hypothetical protein